MNFKRKTIFKQNTHVIWTKVTVSGELKSKLYLNMLSGIIYININDNSDDF